jgi:hypothetical protein
MKTLTITVAVENETLSPDFLSHVERALEAILSLGLAVCPGGVAVSLGGPPVCLVDPNKLDVAEIKQQLEAEPLPIIAGFRVTRRTPVVPPVEAPSDAEERIIPPPSRYGGASGKPVRVEGIDVDRYHEFAKSNRPGKVLDDGQIFQSVGAAEDHIGAAPGALQVAFSKARRTGAETATVRGVTFSYVTFNE